MVNDISMVFKQIPFDCFIVLIRQYCRRQSNMGQSIAHLGSYDIVELDNIIINANIC